MAGRPLACLRGKRALSRGRISGSQGGQKKGRTTGKKIQPSSHESQEWRRKGVEGTVVVT